MLVTRSSGRPFQSTLSVRRATPENREVRSEQEISIHALREESDRLHAHRARLERHFNPRSP